MQDFSQWMVALRSEQRQAGSPASSWADTDPADSDSDSESGSSSGHGEDARQFDLASKRKGVAKNAQREWVRTAPMNIPMGGRQRQVLYRDESVSESPDLSYHADERLLRAGRYLHVHTEDEVDEDDPAFYGNLGFFHSQPQSLQHALAMKQMASSGFSSPFPVPCASTSPVPDDEEIFEMEL